MMMHVRFFNQANIDFMRHRRIAALFSGAALAIGLLSMLLRGFEFGLDFTGGTLVEIGYAQPVEIATVSSVLAQEGFSDAVVQYFGSRQDLLIRLAPRSGEATTSATLSDRVFNALNTQAGGTAQLRRVEYVGPQVGEELREQGGVAVLIALGGILLYVALRFQWRFALAAVAATFHDVLFTLGIFSLFGLSFDLTVLAAILALAGYSLNDTIVIFDRIRENFRKIRKGEIIEITNRSLNETLSRTIITAGTTLIVLFALLLLGGEALFGFSLALIIGIFVGTYSSIYVATALALWLGASRADLVSPPKSGTVVDDRP